MTNQNGTPSPSEHRLNIALVGYGFIGKAHSHAWRSVNGIYNLPVEVNLAAVCDANERAAYLAADSFGWQDVKTDWRTVVERADIDVVDICTPGSSHPEIAVAALDAGKHVLCEKPMANSVDEARTMADAAERAATEGVHAMVGFVYRRVAATALARKMIREGAVGKIREVRVRYLSDLNSDAEAPLTWRMKKEIAGSGALGDLGGHAVDMCRYLTDQEVVEVAGHLQTVIGRRPLERGGSELGDVTVDDAAWFWGRLSDGATASFEVSRTTTGRKNALQFEVSGSLGALQWNLEDIPVLNFYDNRTPAYEAGFRRILATEPQTPYYGAYWAPGHVAGWDDSFINQAADLCRAIADGERPEPSFADGLAVQRVLGAVQRSAASGSAWTSV